jgi:hypothetical protein
MIRSRTAARTAEGRIRELEKLIRAGIDPKHFCMQNQSIVTARQLAAELGNSSRRRPFSLREWLLLVYPEPLTDPDVTLSRHPARVIARRLPTSAEQPGSSRYDRWIS